MKTSVWLAAAVVFAMAAPASAATFVFNLTGSSSTSGTAGNVRSFSSTVGAQTITVEASAWTNAINESPDLIRSSYLGAYSGGLGVTNPYEGSGGSNSHTTDNVGQEDFILLKFSTAVDLESIFVTPYALGGTTDGDATVFYKNNATAPVNNTASSTYFPQFTAINVNGGSSAGSGIVAGTNYSNTWLVSARVGEEGDIDGFKLKSITVGVPEPSTWAMMILGFGAAGSVLRRRRSAALA